MNNPTSLEGGGGRAGGLSCGGISNTIREFVLINHGHMKGGYFTIILGS